MKSHLTKLIALAIVALLISTACSQHEIEMNTLKEHAGDTQKGEETITLDVGATMAEAETDLRTFPFIFDRIENARYRQPKLDLNSINGEVEVVAVIRHVNWPATYSPLICPLRWSKQDNKLSVQSPITLPTGRGVSKWGTEGWRILLFAGGRLDGETGNYIFAPESNWAVASDTWGRTNINALFMSKPRDTPNDPWHPITATENGGILRFVATGLIMQSQGALMMIQVENQSPVTGNRPTAIYFGGLDISTNVASSRGSYSLLNLATNATPTLITGHGGFEATYRLEGSNEEDLTRPRPQGNQAPPAKFSKVHLLYLFPSMGEINQPRFAINGIFATRTGTGLQAQKTSMTPAPPKISHSKIASNNFYYIRLVVNRHEVATTQPATQELKHPIEMLYADENGWGKKFGPGKFSQLSGEVIFKNKRVYEVPTEEMMRVLLPGMTGGIPPGGPKTLPILRFNENTPSSTHVEKELIQTFESIIPLRADYQNTGGYVSYAMRFLGNSDIENRYRAAYRYERILQSNGDSYLKITVRHLGNNHKELRIGNISNETWWNNPSPSNTKEYVRYIYPGRFWTSSGLPLAPRRKLIARVFATKENYESVDRRNGAFVTDYSTFRQWAELEENASSSFVMLFTKQK